MLFGKIIKKKIINKVIYIVTKIIYLYILIKSTSNLKSVLIDKIIYKKYII